LGVVHPRVPDLIMADLPASLSREHLDAVRSIGTDGAGVSVILALAGTGKTRVLPAGAGV
jgi:hypothetical protein